MSKEVFVESREYIQLYENCLIGNFVPPFSLFLFALKNLKKSASTKEIEEIEKLEERFKLDYSELLTLGCRIIFKEGEEGANNNRSAMKPQVVNVVIGDAIEGFQPTTNTDIFDILVEFDFFPSKKQARKNFSKARELTKGYNKFEIGRRILNILLT